MSRFVALAFRVRESFRSLEGFRGLEFGVQVFRLCTVSGELDLVGVGLSFYGSMARLGNKSRQNNKKHTEKTVEQHIGFRVEGLLRVLTISSSRSNVVTFLGFGSFYSMVQTAATQNM